ncbi:Hypothetical predicted protein, partial [Paramuricea clavata]
MKRSAIVSGSTPGKPAVKTNKRQGEPSSRKSLFDFKTEKKDNINQPDQWSIEERKALVEYVALFTPVSQDQAFPGRRPKKQNFGISVLMPFHTQQESRKDQ